MKRLNDKHLFNLLLFTPGASFVTFSGCLGFRGFWGTLLPDLQLRIGGTAVYLFIYTILNYALILVYLRRHYHENDRETRLKEVIVMLLCVTSVFVLSMVLGPR